MTDTPQTEKLNFTTKLAYGAGDLGPAITANLLVFFLLPFLTNVAGLPAGIAGSVLMVGKIFDAVNDPIVGVMSDRTKSPWGRRIPWIFWGAIPFGVLFFLQWIVPRFSDDLNTNQILLAVYYIFIGIVFNIAYTAVNLPYTALTPELTEDYDERTNLNSFRFTFSIGGSILSLILAAVVFASYPGQEGLQFLLLGIISAILSIIAIYWCVFRIQERGYQPLLSDRQKKLFGKFIAGLSGVIIIYSLGRVIVNMTALEQSLDLMGICGIITGITLILVAISLIFTKTEPHLLEKANKSENSDNQPETQIPFFQQLKIVFQNRAFVYVIGIYLCSWLAVQLTASILVYYVVSYMGLTNTDSSFLALAVQGTALIMLFVWQILSERFGKKAVYYMGTGFWLIAQAGLFLLKPGQITLMYCLGIIAGFGVSVAYLIPWSMVPDVIELDELQTGQRREGIFYGFMVLLQKFGLALGLFLVGIALEMSGFQESLPGQDLPIQPESALFAIRLAIAPIPTICLIVGIVLAYLYPITKEYHAEIRLKLQERRSK
jgi:glycoside/pentoside/hexuronide:cation symporter, GPH family